MSAENETQTSEPDNSPQAWADAETPEETGAPPASEAASDEEAAPQADGEEGEAAEAAPEADPYAEAPEFWSAERKAQWAKVTDPELRQAIHEQEKERLSAVNRKIEEAAIERKKYEADTQQAVRDRDELAAWWKDTGPKLANAFQNKWASVDWNRLATEDPGQWAALKQQYENDSRLIGEAAQKHQAEIGAANQRAQKALGEAKAVEHSKLERTLPEHFKGEKAQKTYDELGAYLTKQGFPADRVTAIYEAPVIEIALKAMLYDKAKAESAKVTSTTQQGQPTTATQTPRRIAPGASQNRGANPQQSEAYRQASERLKSGDRLTEQDARVLFA